MTSTALEKVNKPKNKSTAKKKPKMDYFLALETIEKYEEVLKKASTHRMAKPSEADINFGERGMLAGIGLHVAIIAGYVGVSNIAGTFDIFYFALLGMLGVPLSMMAGGNLGAKHPDVLAPFKYREEIMRHQQDLLFYQISEEAYVSIESEVLKKTRKALKIINEKLALEGREMVYSNHHGHEGFYIEQSFALTEIDRLKLTAASTPEQKSKISEIVPASSPAMKALSI